MLVTVHCPSCNNTYHLEPTMLGKRMRCTNPLCREVFEIRNDSTAGESFSQPQNINDKPAPDEAISEKVFPAEAKKPEPTKLSGSVGDIVPILSAEASAINPDQEVDEISSGAKPKEGSADIQDVISILPAGSADPIESSVDEKTSPWVSPPPVRNRAKHQPPSRSHPGEHSDTESPVVPAKGESNDSPGALDWEKQHSPFRTQSQVQSTEDGSVHKVGSEIGGKDRKSGASSAKLEDKVSPNVQDSGLLNASTPSVAIPPSYLEAPPIRRGTDPVLAGIPAASMAPTEAPLSTFASSKNVSPRRRIRWIIGGIIGFVILALGAGTWYVFSQLQQTEAARYEVAKTQYETGLFAKAEKSFSLLAADFPESTQAPEYHFLAQLSAARNVAAEVSDAPSEALKEFEAFIDNSHSSAFFSSYKKDIGETLERLMQNLLATVPQPSGPSDDLAQARLKLAKVKTVRTEIEQYLDANALSRLDSRIIEIENAIEANRRRQETLAWIGDLEASPENIPQVEQRLRQVDLINSRAGRKSLEKFKKAVLARIGYTAAINTLEPNKAMRPDSEPSVVILPELVRTEAIAKAIDDGTVFAVCRGVLYALSKKNGAFLWATRIGIDSSALPVRIPPSETSPEEVILALSSDTNTLTASYSHNGQEIWHHQFKAGFAGQPLVLNRHAFVATSDGNIYEIELASGQMIGWFHLGQSLRVGGIAEETSNLLYYVADSLNVYILDAAQRKCIGILQTGHTTGSVRSKPIIFTPSQLESASEGPGNRHSKFFVINQAEGFTRSKLRVYALPIEGMVAVPPLQPETQLQGWSSFQPTCDGEKLALVTDAGTFSLIGINQSRNQDRPLFALYPADQGPTPVPSNIMSGRAQVVNVQGNDVWALIQGNLYRWKLGIDRKSGVRLSPAIGWPQRLSLGFPLHAAQVDTQSSSIFCVTRSLGQNTCLATAVDAIDGHAHWQRQLGMLIHGQPLQLGNELVAVDESGQLFLFSPDKETVRSNSSWMLGGEKLAKGMDNVVCGPFLMSGPQDKRATEIACLLIKAGGDTHYELVVRQFNAELHQVVERIFHLGKNYLVGLPAISDDTLWLPLSNGNLFRQPMDKDRGNHGPSWRAPNSEETVSGHAVFLEKDQFISTDGKNGVSHWTWRADQPVAKEDKKIALAHRIASVPVLVPPELNNGEKLICLADSNGTVFLFRAGDLQTLRTWQLKGTITAGPFLRGKYLGCVADHHRLVWLDMQKDGEAWHFDTGSDGIVGEPSLVKGSVILADLAGRFIGLEVKTGKSLGEGYLLKANLTPASAPLAYGTNRLFAPLTDGTILLPSLDHFQSKP